MKVPALLMSDPHFTANPKDEYRWGIWKWLREQCVEERIKTLVICGDLTDAKDYHPSTLTNRLVTEILETKKVVEEIIILQGNHDYLREGHSYFAFLSLIPGIEFVTKPTDRILDGGPTARFMPHNRNPAEAWKGQDFSHYDMLFIHQTIKGSRASNGMEMEGEEMPALNALKVWSGDIHVPQVIGGIEYIGSPYHVHFGDAFKGRCVVLDRRGKPFDLHYPSIARLAITAKSIEELGILVFQSTAPGDQIKIKIELAEADKHNWSNIKRQALALAKEAEVDLHGLQLVVERSQRSLSGAINRKARTERLPDAEILFRFVEGEELGADAYEVGMEILK